MSNLVYGRTCQNPSPRRRLARYAAAHKANAVKDELLMIDVFQRFEHEDGEALLASFRRRLAGLRSALAEAHWNGAPVIYVNNGGARWDSNAPELVRAAIEDGSGGDIVAELAPRPEDFFVLKPHDGYPRGLPGRSLPARRRRAWKASPSLRRPDRRRSAALARCRSAVATVR